MPTIVLKPDDIIYFRGQANNYIGKVDRISYTYVLIHWDDGSSTHEDICMELTYDYIGNLQENDEELEKRLLALRLKGYYLPSLRDLKGIFTL